MSHIHSAPNDKVLQLIGSLEGDPWLSRKITFSFCSKEEGSVYRLASTLQKKKFSLFICKSRKPGKWLCIAEKKFVPAEVSLGCLCMRMVDLADKFDVIFESWETVIPRKV